MNTTPNPIQLAADLYKARDAMRQLLGDDYKPRMKLLADSMLKAANAQPDDILIVAIAACKACNATGIQAIATLAAAVELIEPTP